MLGNTYETFPANHTRATCTPDTLEASMGLLDSLKSTFTSSGEASVPPAASFATREGVIYAPVNGVLVNLSEVPDETIASGMLGQATASNQLPAPSTPPPTAVSAPPPSPTTPSA